MVRNTIHPQFSNLTKDLAQKIECIYVGMVITPTMYEPRNCLVFIALILLFVLEICGFSHIPHRKQITRKHGEFLFCF